MGERVTSRDFSALATTTVTTNSPAIILIIINIIAIAVDTLTRCPRSLSISFYMYSTYTVYQQYRTFASCLFFCLLQIEDKLLTL